MPRRHCPRSTSSYELRRGKIGTSHFPESAYQTLALVYIYIYAEELLFCLLYRRLLPVGEVHPFSFPSTGGGIIAKIRQETGAKIKLEESVPGCEERVVIITGSEKDSEFKNEQTRQDEGDSPVVGGEEDDASAVDDAKKEDSDNFAGSKLVKATSCAQKALMLVFERIFEGELESDDVDEGKNKTPLSVRLLVLSSQVGPLLGKGGHVVKQMSADSGAQIRVLPRDKLPLCASFNDEIVQISGGVDSMRKALRSVSQHLMENPPRDRDFAAVNSHSSSSHPFPPIPRQEAFSPAKLHMPVKGPPFLDRPLYDAADISPSFPKFHEGLAPGPMPLAPEVLVFRLLCSNDKVGSVIGKGGSIVRTIEHETGCEIKVLESSLETHDRIIVISGPSLPGDRISPPQDAVLRVQHRIVMAVPENKDSVVLSRVLVYSNQTGCLLGKGGSVIAEMRRLSGANIRVLSKDQTPKGLEENNEIIQVTGEFGAVQEALLQITARLRGHLFRDKAPALNHPPHPVILDKIPAFGPYMGRMEPSPQRSFDNPIDMERLPPVPWAPQGMTEGVVPLPDPDFGKAPPRRIGGFPGGNQPAVITRTTVDVVVPRSVVPSIYGEDGDCLRRIREISDADIVITEPRPEAKETAIIISGTPEQTHAAQSLIQAFVLSETTAP
ncbi:KH domain-containing protein [Apostasia shenzhenica]|uniref:KH domain-containing protein n=1 Tax=Apostasia shenzhenica TaxID=1088818 RepID=A0A2I0BDW0_9ASPA|nr:KH domain-containing protein [Apostasia shenzhenica]